MDSVNKIGIWMDYRTAHIMEFSEKPREVDTLESKLSTLGNTDHQKHLRTKERQLKDEYFKKIADIILKYDRVLLFGPGNAKKELFNILSEDHRFFKIKIHLKETGKMNLTQRNEFIYDHFANPIFK